MPISILPIEPPGVEIDVVFDSASVTTRVAALPACLMAPCYRIVDAFDSAGAVDTTSRAGAYLNGMGSIAYAYPSFPVGATLDTDSVRVFLQSGANASELNSPSDESIVQTATSAGWSYDHAGGSDYANRELTLTNGLVETLGVVAGDVVRVTMPANGPLDTGVEADLVIEAVLSSGNTNTVVQIEESSSWGFDLTASGTTYKLVKDAAQFAVNSSAVKATRTILNNTSTANNGIVLEAETAGSVGDSIQITFIDDGTAGSELVEISAIASGGYAVVVHYEDTVSTWAQVATALQTANDALAAGSRPFTGSTGAAAVGTGGTAAAAPADLVAIGDYDGNATFLLDGGADADTVVLDADLLNLMYSIPLASTYAGYALVQYRALRLDVSPEAAAPTLLNFANATEMIASIGPVDTRNPLALAFQKAFDNAPNTRTYGIGVGAVSTAFPFGTLTAWNRVFDYLSTQRVPYALAPITQQPSVAQALSAHLTANAARSGKNECIGFWSSAEVTNAADGIVVSGTANGEVTDVGTVGGVDDGDTFASGDNFSTAGGATGNVLVIDGQTGAYELGNGLTGWYVTAVAAGSVTVDDRDVDGTNVAVWPQIAEDLTWTLYEPGAALTQASDKAQAIAERSYGFANKRLAHVLAPEVAITVGSSQQRLPGSYACAALAGQVGGLAPQLPHSNRPLFGIDAVYGTHDTFANDLLNLIAGGGTWTLIQNSGSSPVITRHQLSTNTLTIEVMHMSVTKVLDYLARYLRAVLTPFTGNQNTTGAYLDSLVTQIEGHKEGFIRQGLVADFNLLDLVQDDTTPTLLLADVSVDMFYPADNIRTTLRV